MEIEMFLERIIPYIIGILKSMGAFLIFFSILKTFIMFVVVFK